jgi:DNA-binding NtrC family response regulator
LEKEASAEENVVIPQGMRLEELEKIAIYQALETSQGNKTDTAEQLGISVKTLYNKLSKYEQESDVQTADPDTVSEDPVSNSVAK